MAPIHQGRLASPVDLLGIPARQHLNATGVFDGQRSEASVPPIPPIPNYWADAPITAILDQMQRRNSWLTVIVFFIVGACGARTGGDFDALGAGDWPATVGGAGTGGSSAWTAGGSSTWNPGGSTSIWPIGGAQHTGGAAWTTPGGYGYGGSFNSCPSGSWGCSCYSNSTCNYPYSCSYGTCGYNSTCSPGAWGCACYSNATCNYPYFCSNGTCVNSGNTGGAGYGGTGYGGGTPTCTTGTLGCACYSSGACTSGLQCNYGICSYPYPTGGATWGGSSACPMGAWGCRCFTSGMCASPYTCIAGYCIGTVTTGGAPSYGGSPPIGTGGWTYITTGGSTPVGYGGTTYVTNGGSPPVGGRSSYGGTPSSSLVATGGVSPLDACAESLQACMADQVPSGCNYMLACIGKYSSVCSNDVSCYLLQCMSSLSGSSMALAIQLFQNCSTVLGL